MFRPGFRAFALNNNQRIHKSAGGNQCRLPAPFLKASITAFLRSEHEDFPGRRHRPLSIIAHTFKRHNTPFPRQKAVIPEI